MYDFHIPHSSLILMCSTNTELTNLKSFGRFCITQMPALHGFNYFLLKPCRVWLFGIPLGMEKHLNRHSIYHTNNWGCSSSGNCSLLNPFGSCGQCANCRFPNGKKFEKPAKQLRSHFGAADGASARGSGKAAIRVNTVPLCSVVTNPLQAFTTFSMFCRPMPW